MGGGEQRAGWRMFFVVEGGAKGWLAHVFCDGGGGQRAGWRMFFVVEGGAKGWLAHVFFVVRVRVMIRVKARVWVRVSRTQEKTEL